MKLGGILLCIVLTVGVIPSQYFIGSSVPIKLLSQAHAQIASHPNLFVSTENSQYNNYFAGPQVVQVIVADPNINRLDQAYGEPVVTVNGKRLRMAQNTDSNWYGYFADRNQAELATTTAPIDGKGLNFGFFCSPTASINLGHIKAGLDFSQTKGFTIAYDGNGSTTHVDGPYASQFGNQTSGSGNPTAACNFAFASTPSVKEEHIIRENKTLNANPSGFAATNVYQAIWPVIQLYDFSAIPTPVTVDYQAAGGDQIVNLTFDRIPQNLISITPDKTIYEQNTPVFLSMNDTQLNIDPTEEDSWTWGANQSSPELFYQAFDRNGNPDAEANSLAMQNLIGNLTMLMFNHNGKLTINPKVSGVRILDFQSNGKQSLMPTRGDPSLVTTAQTGPNVEPITFTEQGGVNTGIFGNWDGAHKSNVIMVNSGSSQGYSATISYNGISTNIFSPSGSAGTTGSVKLDRSVYPVPFGSVGATTDFAPNTAITNENGVFPMHRDTTGENGQPGTSGGIPGLSSQNTLSLGDVIVHARVNDRDYVSNGTSVIGIGVFDNKHGPVAFQITRQGESMLLATAGGPSIVGGKIVDLNGTNPPSLNANAWSQVRDLGPMPEISPGAGIFQTDLPIRYTDGPPGTDCPVPQNFDGSINGTGFRTNSGVRFYTPVTALPTGSGTYCVRQGDVLTVTYYDTKDASGHPQTVTDSATFDLRTGQLQSDKSVYVLGSDMILTLVEPDLNLDSQTAETVPLDVVEWDSQEFKGTLGPLGGQTKIFQPTPVTFVETGKDTGIFQAVIKIQNKTGVSFLPGDKITLQYTDWGPSGSKTVGNSKQDVSIQVSISPYTILLKTGPVTPPAVINISSIKGNLTSDSIVHFLLQFKITPNYSQRIQIGNQGIRLTDYVTGNTYIASSKVANLTNVYNFQGIIQSAGPFYPDYKISPILKTNNLSNNAPWANVTNQSGQQEVVLTISLNKDANMSQAIQSMTDLGGTIVSTMPPISAITAIFDLAKLNDTVNQIANLDAVQFVSPVDPPLSPHNDQARKNAHLEGIPFPDDQLNGSGVVALVFDVGSVDFHAALDSHSPGPCPESEFRSHTCRLILLDSVPADDHSTSVAGILGGDGKDSQNSYPIAGLPNQWRGMAPKIGIISAAFHSNNPNGCGASGCKLWFYDDYGNMAADFTNAENLNVNLATMSMGVNLMENCYPDYDTLLGYYADTSQLIDGIVTGNGFPKKLPFFESVGNNLNFTGCDHSKVKKYPFFTIDSPAAAKDSIAVGDINSNDYSIANRTDFGPTATYLIKPDIVAPGCRTDLLGMITSTGQTQYGPNCGTSFSAPVAAGVASQLIEKLNSTYGTIPEPDTIKAILIHTAVDLGNPGPDYKFGWGAVNAKAAINLINNDATLSANKLINTGSIDSGGHMNFYFNSDGSEDVKATLVWDDPQSPDPTNGLIQNPMNLTLTDPHGNVYYPYLLNPFNPEANATTSNDVSDNVNDVKMAIGNASSGLWNATVSADVGTMKFGPQTFTLIISHTYKRYVDMSVDPASKKENKGDTITFTVRATDNDGGQPLPFTGYVSWNDTNYPVGTFTNSAGISSNVCQLSPQGSCIIHYVQQTIGDHVINATLHDQTHQHQPISVSVSTVPEFSSIAPLIFVVALILILVVPMKFRTLVFASEVQYLCRSKW